jgi:curved DNA-binding protein CbpA
MANPYRVLDASPEDTDEAIRRRYLEAVRRYPPERFPAEFQRIREAYECIRDQEHRLEFLLFEPAQGESLDELLAEERCRTSCRRVSLRTLLSFVGETQ